MRYIQLLILTLLFPAVVFAQKTTADSLYLYNQDFRIINYIIQSGTGLISSDISKLSTVSLNYQQANGHFRTAQQAEKSKTIDLATSGITTLGRFKLYGTFNFNRSWQDSLAWTMQGLPNIAEPYYYAAGKAGKYQRLRYTMGGLVTYQLPGENFYIASGLDYQYNDASRSVDPRPSIQTFHLLVSPEMIYKKEKHSIGAGLLWGYEQEKNAIGYKNRDFNQGLSYPDRVNYLMMGYGYYTIGGSDKIERQSDFFGLNVNYAYVDSATTLRSRFAYKKQKEDNFFPLANSTTNRLFSSFLLNDYRFSILASQQHSSFRHQLQADVNYQKGNDRNVELGGVNYRYSSYTAQLGYSIQTFSSSSVNYEFGFNGLLYNQQQKDISAAHTVDFTYFKPGIQATLYKKYQNADRLKVSLSPAVRLPVSSSFTVPPAQVNVFTTNIAYPAYTYNTSTVGSVDGSVEYITSHFIKDVRSGLAIHSSYYKPLTTGTVYTGSTFIPSKSFLDLSFSFNIYF
jgi:hypothetical protein